MQWATCTFFATTISRLVTVCSRNRHSRCIEVKADSGLWWIAAGRSGPLYGGDHDDVFHLSRYRPARGDADCDPRRKDSPLRALPWLQRHGPKAVTGWAQAVGRGVDNEAPGAYVVGDRCAWGWIAYDIPRRFEASPCNLSPSRLAPACALHWGLKRRAHRGCGHWPMVRARASPRSMTERRFPPPRSRRLLDQG